MFGSDPSDLIATLGKMQDEALRRVNYDQTAIHNEVVNMVRNDRRLDAFDPDRLVAQAWKVRNSGGRLDWDDPYLKKGGQPRPQARRGTW
jgi:hypothetical protein